LTGAYIVAEAIFVISLIITASAYASTMFNFVDDLKQANQAKIARMKREALTSVEPLMSYVSDNRSIVHLWLKNVGTERISYAEIEASDIFLIGRETFSYMKYGQGASRWTYNVLKENLPDNGWSWGETLEITLRLEAPLNPGEYTVKVAGPYFSATHVFSLGE
jgi:archaellum component FlaG (FlaF/FlaG flagellin family)